ncbi:DUF1294 domain-containing protein [Actibacterium sp.]|uniref:DUF1294 domain-containing protein n=1 Tax=Actibacterium sp. TaxID=1872125 RepID=UPI00356361FB
MGATMWILALLGVNLWSLALFAWDKSQARRYGWRVSEFSFLLLAACGGWPALKLGQRLLRHKTRKQPFGRQMNLMIGVNLLLAVTVWILLSTEAGLPFPDTPSKAPNKPTTHRFFQSVGG